MKIVAKCLAFVSLPYQVHVKVCNPIPLTRSNKTIVVLFFQRRNYQIKVLKGNLILQCLRI